MDEQISDREQSADTSENEFFLRVDLFDHVTRSLSATYSMLWLIETKKEVYDTELSEKYRLRHQEIAKLKDGFPPNGIRRRDRAARGYLAELQQLRNLLGESY